MSDDRSERRVLDGDVWSEFCDELKAAGRTIIRNASPEDPFDRAEGFRYLTRLVRMGLESQLEFADPRAPVLYRNVHETGKVGADNPDNAYYTSAISGEYDYRISGQLGTAAYLGIGTYSPGLDGRETHGYVERSDLVANADGSAEIILSSKERPGNWLPMQPTTRTLLIRQTFLDRQTEIAADLHIELLDPEIVPEPLTPRQLDRGLRTTAKFVRGYAAMFAEWADSFRERPNELPELDPAKAAAAGGDPNIRYYNGYWELGPDEALVIEVTPPACDFWNFQVNNYWMESLDYRYERIHLNPHSAELDADGSLRIILTHGEPAGPNWLSTAGHRLGTMTLRWVGASEFPAPTTRVVARAQLS